MIIKLEKQLKNTASRIKQLRNLVYLIEKSHLEATFSSFILRLRELSYSHEQLQNRPCSDTST